MVSGNKQKKKETYKVINPATEEVLGEASKASSVDVQKALKSAEKGLETWKNTTPWQRSYVTVSYTHLTLPTIYSV